jgi:hypothetical protein
VFEFTNKHLPLYTMVFRGINDVVDLNDISVVISDYEVGRLDRLSEVNLLRTQRGVYPEGLFVARYIGTTPDVPDFYFWEVVF